MKVRMLTLTAAGVAAGLVWTTGSALAQSHDHGQHAHSHAGGPVDCATLATPPWTGLSERDRQIIRQLESAVANLGTTEAARAAGFRPALGNIPTMGVHWVHPVRSRSGVNIAEPDHLLFAPVDGEEKLVGVAYAFTDSPDTRTPVPFESDLAHWHDHPQFAGAGQTLHMLHVWFVPSSNGPFAGNNFWLPFYGAGIQPPSACWMADEEVAERIQRVAMVLALTQLDDSSIFARARAATDGAAGETLAARSAELDSAARAGDPRAWVAAADRFIASRPPADRLRAEVLLRTLTMAQMSSGEREAARQ